MELVAREVEREGALKEPLLVGLEVGRVGGGDADGVLQADLERVRSGRRERRVRALPPVPVAALEAAAVNVWKAYTKTAEDVRAEAKKAAEAAAKREGERAAKKAEREAKNTKNAAEAAAKLREKIEKDREKLAKLEAAAAEQKKTEAKKTAAA